MTTEDPVLLLTRAVIQMVKTERARTDAIERRAEQQEREMVAMRADHQQAMADIVEAIRAIPPAVVNMAAPDPVVIPPAEVQVTVPPVQHIVIDALPRLKAKATKNRDGSTTISEV